MLHPDSAVLILSVMSIFVYIFNLEDQLESPGGKKFQLGVDRAVEVKIRYYAMQVRRTQRLIIDDNIFIKEGESRSKRVL